jgi:hypothetical protein
MKSFIRIPFILLIVFFGAGCKKNFNADAWAPTVLGPVATGTVTTEIVSDIRNKQFQQQIDPYDIGYSPGTVVPHLPALSIKELGPFANQISPYFKYALVDSANLKVSFVNNFPVAIKQGTTIVLSSDSTGNNPSNIIISSSISSDIAPNSTYTFPVNLANQNIPSTIYLYLDNFQTDSGTNVVFNSQPTMLSFNLNILKVKLIAINTNKSYTLIDTTGFQISASQSGSVSDSSLAGTFRIFLTNKLPVNLTSQLILLDINKNAIDSLVQGSGLAPAATTDVNGNVITSEQSNILIPINYTKLHNLSQCQYIVYRIKADTYGMPGSVVYAGMNNGADFQIVTDMKVKMGSFFN